MRYDKLRRRRPNLVRRYFTPLRGELLEQRLALSALTIKLSTTDLVGNPITTIEAGGEFILRGTVQAPTGAVFAWADVTYDPVLVTVNGPIIPGALYPGTSGDASIPGLINEVGGGYSSVICNPTCGAPGSGEIDLFSVRFKASLAYDGQRVDFTLDHADEFDHASAVFGPPAVLVTPSFVNCSLGEKVKVEINRTREKTDNLTLLNPIGVQQPWIQTIPVKFTNQLDSPGTFQLSVEPLGAATLSEQFIDLAAGESKEVVVTPQANSLAPHDVRIVAKQGDQKAGEDTMTIVKVVLPQNIRNGNTPPGVPDRIPPREPTLIPVQLTPSLAGTGQSVTLLVSGQNPDNGTVNFSGSAMTEITTTGDVSLFGGIQTAPTLGGNASQLRLVTRVRNEDTTRSFGFSVAAIPINTHMVVVDEAEGPFRGFLSQITWVSDSGNLGDLDNAFVNEAIEELRPHQGVFESAPPIIDTPDEGFVQASSGGVQDLQISGLILLTGPGQLNANQVFRFRNYRLADVTESFPMPNSGYRLQRRTFLDGQRLMHTASVVGMAVTAAGFTTSAGTGAASVTQVVNEPPTLSPINNPADVREDSGTQVIQLSGISAGETEVQNLRVEAASDNPSLTGPISLEYTSPNTTGLLYFTPQSDQYGTATIEVRVWDSGVFQVPAVRTFTINVTAVNDAPKCSSPTSSMQVSDEDGPQSISVDCEAGPDNESTQNVFFNLTTSGESLFSEPPSINPSGRITFDPAPNASGIATVTIEPKDNGGTDNEGKDMGLPFQFTIEVVKQHASHNALVPKDVSGDGEIVAGDALDVINYLNAFGAGAVSVTMIGPPYYDVTHDSFVAADDALEIINHLNAFGAGEGENRQWPYPVSEAPTMSESDFLSLLALDVASQPRRRR